MKYPTWKVRGEPTPNDTLWVCDECGKAEWGTDTSGAFSVNCYSCTGRKGGFKRMRRGTPAETTEAKKHLQEVIG